MLRISALNDSFSSQDSQGSHFVKEATKEAKEAETYSLYNKALVYLRNGETEKAEEVFRDLIDHDFLQEAIDLLEERSKDAIHPGLQLLYSIYKNLAAMATQKKDYSSAMDWYLEAVKIDNSEVTVWYKVGVTALKIEDHYLAKTAFVEGLECNPKHWPCLDNIIPVMYSLNNYAECLYFISKAFEMDIYYEKGHAIRNKIYQEQPCLQTDFEEFFMYCDKELSDVKIDADDAKKYVEEALHMRRRRQELSKPPEPVRLKFPEKLRDYSWECVGETLMDLYDKAVTSKPIISLCITVDVPDYEGVASEKEASKEQDQNNVKTESEKQKETKDIKVVSDENGMDAESKEKNEVPMETDNDEIIDDSKAENEDKEVESNAMDTDATDDKDKVLVEKEDRKSPVENVETNEVDKKSKNGEKVHASGVEQMDVTEGNGENKDKQDETPVSAEDANEEASNDSALEAARLTHKLLDGLSPSKPPENTEDKKDKENIDHTKSSTESLEQVTEGSKTKAAHPTLTKSLSLGFSVTHITTDTKEESPNLSEDPKIDQGNAESPTAKNASSADSSDIKTADNNKTGESDGEKPSEINPLIKEVVPVSAPVIDLTELDSDSQTEDKDNDKATSQKVANETAAIISTTTNTGPISTTSGPISVSSVHVSVSSSAMSSAPTTQLSSIDTTGSTNPTTQQNTNTVSTASDYGASIQYKDHAYSKASSQHSSVAMVTSPRGEGQMVLVSCIPVTQPLLKNVDSHVGSDSPMIDLDLDDQSAASRRNQKKRKISMATEEIMMYGKRRSTRVRNPGKKKEEAPVNVKDLLLAFLPSTLKNVQDEEGNTVDSLKDESFAADKSNQDESFNNKQETKPNYTVWDETQDVKSFLKGLHVKNAGLVDVMNRYLHVIAEHWKLKWSDSLCAVYMNVYNRARKHLYMPNPLDTSDAPDIFQEMALICLAFSEFKLDDWLTERSKSHNSSPVGKSSETLSPEEIPKYFDEDILFLTMLCGQTDRLENHWIDHCVRVYWMKSKYAILQGKIEEAIYSFERLKEYFEYMKEEYLGQQVVIPNCTMENIVTLDLVTSKQDLLQKSHCVEETQRLYNNEEYEQVVEILLQTFAQPQHKAKVLKVEDSERQSQLSLLQDAMYKTKKNGRSLLWGEESLNEAYQEYKTTTSVEEKSTWLKTMIEILDCLQKVVDREITAIRSLPSAKLVRLTQNLVRMIDKNMSLPDTATEMVIDTVTPWALLYQLIKHEEDKIESLRIKEQGANEDLDDAIPSSQMLLNIAHDYLGGRSWCTRSDGSLLLFFMGVLKQKMEVESENQEEFQQSFEQCVYCLFGHPNKKAKAKHLQDHNVTGIPLQWEHAVMVFDFFKPKTIPEFDGYKSETISTELEVLFKRIIPLVPENCKAKMLSHDEVFSYIEGSKDTPPALREDVKVDSSVLEDIYYLLGDYYLKNKEAVKAVKFYMLDLCVNPGRLDSWAGMALARMSQLDSRLTSAELKMDFPIYKKSIAALRCFKRATELEDSNPKLWIEYGTLAYQLHAHASKQIRWKKWFAMDQELVKIAVESKREMVQTALDCFRQASEWNDEAWLHNYMIGKCLEKMGKPIKDVLQYYFQALSNVHDDKAKYPKKIVYAYTTPHLSVEALEMYYRIHCVILKYLMKHGPESGELDYKLLVTSLVDAQFTPFVLRVEKGQEAKVDRESASSADESSSSEMTTPSKKLDEDSPDHTYVRQKSLQDSNTGSESTNTGMQKNTGVTLTDPNQESTRVTSSNDNQINKTGATTSNDGENSNKVEGESNELKPKAVVTTLELHADQSSSCEGVTLTTSRTEFTADNKTSSDGLTGATPKDIAQIGVKPPENVSVDDKGSGRQDLFDEKGDKTETVEDTVKGILDHIQDMVVKTVDGSNTVKDDGLTEKMEVDEEEQKNENNQNKSGSKGSNLSTKKEEMLESLLKLSNLELHRELMDQCRKAFELCLNRFPTHYKSHYRLAQLYFKCDYFKDLKKAHNIMLSGTVNWKQLTYMPCQALFGERKMNKFFQGIWKIPIDEIDRAGSFPSHLNRCIDLILHILKEEGDCHVLHQVHLQLNKQPEPGKKYLRDAEKKYYALTSHRFTLDAAEARIQEMKTITDAEQRHKFLLLFYKIWEHGVHKLNKHADRTNKLLAEAYRVVVRKLETLPQKMLLDQAVRYCKHLMQQKSKSDKDSTPDTKGKPKSGVKLSTAKETVVKAIPQLNLESLMKAQTQNTLMKAQTQNSVAKPADDNKQVGKVSTDKVMDTEDKVQGKESKGHPDDIDDAIVIDSSDDEPDQPEVSNDKVSDARDTKTDALEQIGDVANTKTGDSAVNKTADAESKTVDCADSKAPTVKIKMGLLQAVKRFKPNPVGEEGNKHDNNTEEKMEVDDEAGPSREQENAGPEPPNNNDNDDESSSSSSSDSSSDNDSSADDDDDDKNAGDDDSDNDGSDGSSSSSSEDESDKPETKLSKAEVEQIEKSFKPPDIQLTISSSNENEEDESSDNSQEIDLISSDDNQGKDDDTDYKASEDENVIASDEEFKDDGRAVVPSPPHREQEDEVSGDKMEVLVEKVPDFDPMNLLQ